MVYRLEPPQFGVLLGQLGVVGHVAAQLHGAAGGHRKLQGVEDRQGANADVQLRGFAPLMQSHTHPLRR